MAYGLVAYGLVAYGLVAYGLVAYGLVAWWFKGVKNSRFRDLGRVP